LVCLALGSAALLGAVPALVAQTRARDLGDRVIIRTADGVELVGTYYSGSRKSPCVLFLHGLGEKGHSRSWRPLAELLHKDGYAVLSFDFRGHGQSTTVEPETFWMQPANRAGIDDRQDEEIRAADFKGGYWPVLANDIGAVRSFLDRKNDLGECNASNLILIGADEGATLGALWLHSECYRYRQHPAPFFGALPQLNKTPEIDRVLAAVWFNIASDLGTRSLSLTGLLAAPAQRYRVPMVFVHDTDNPAARRTAQALDRDLSNAQRLPYTGAVQVPAGNVQHGEQLMERYPAQRLLDYLESVKDAQADEWQELEPRKAQYVWRTRFMAAPANQVGMETLLFNTYQAFLR
jgi:alpha-beta hydrolase superfamily lysophospholipase